MKQFLLDRHFTHLFHISDIHILNGEERQTEFRVQFTKTFQTIKTHPKFNNTSVLIVVTGDLLDKGIKMSAIAIELLQLFIEGLTKLAPTIIIPGNHDDKKDVGTSTLDVLTAVFNENNQQRPNLYYLKYTGIYLFGDNLAFGHTSVIDKHLIKADDIQTTNRLKIGLFHGMIDSVSSDNTSNDTSFILKSCDFMTNDFNGYDKVLLGDIHKAHSVGDDQRLWYAGSLVQKSFAEDRRQHGGLLVWDVYSDCNTPPQYLHIPNDHQYIVLKIDKGHITGEYTTTTGSLHMRTLVPFQVHSLGKQSSIRFKCDSDTQHKDIDILKTQLGTKTIIVKDNRVWPTEIQQTNQQNVVKNTNATTRDPFSEYLDVHYPDDKEALTELHREYRKNTQSNQQTNTCYGKWNLDTLTLENIYNYKNRHTIPFKNLANEIISITGKNGTGKSKIIDGILLAIYGCTPKLVPHIITNGLQKGTTSITIQINSDNYLIRRTFTRKRRQHETTIHIYKNGIETSATDKYQNEQAIILLFGERDDLCDTHISLQGHHQAFIHKKPKEQKELLKRIFNLNMYETLEKSVKTEITTTKQDIKLANNDLEKYPLVSIDGIQTQLETLYNNTPILQQKKDKQIQLLRNNDKAEVLHTTITEKITSLDKQIQKQQQTRSQIPYSNDEIQTRLKTSKTLIETLDIKIKELQSNIDKCREDKHPIKNTLLDDIQQLQSNMDASSKKYKNDTSTLETILSQQIQTNKQLTTLDSEITTIKDRQNTLPKNKYSYHSIQEYKQELSKMSIKPLTKTQTDTLEQTHNDINHFLVEHPNLSGIDTQTILDNQYTTYQNTTLNQTLLTSEINSINREIETINQFLDIDPFTYNHSCLDCQKNRKHNLIPEKLIQLKKNKENLATLHTRYSTNKTYLESNKQIPLHYKLVSHYKNNLSKKSHLEDISNKYIHYINLKDEYSLFQKEQDTINILTNKLHDILETKKTLDCLVKKQSDKMNHLRENIQTLQLQLQTDKNRMETFIQTRDYITKNAKLDSEISIFTKKVKCCQHERQKQYNTIDQLYQMQRDLSKDSETECQINTLISEKRVHELTISNIHLVSSTQLEETLHHTTKQLEKHLHDIECLENEKKIQTNNQKLRRNLMDNIEIHQYDLDLQTKYLKITQDYPLYLNKKGIQRLEILINRYLWNMASFTIKILDEGGVITFLKVDHKQQIPIDYCSGFEKFAISIAIRIALAKIHPFNSMNSLFIDEGFGVFDSENLKRLPEMLEPLTNIFAQIFIITHIDDLQSVLQHKITITNDSKGFPTINY